MRSISIFWLVLIALLTGCGDNSREEINKLIEENKSLKNEISELKYGASRLLSQAESEYTKKNWKETKLILEKLKENHPGSSESTKADSLLNKVISEIKAEEITAAKLAAESAAKEEKIKIDEQKRISSATSRMRTKYDEIEGVTWYSDKSSPKFANANSFHIYFGKKKGESPWLRLKVQYSADDWLFIRAFTLVVDGRKFEKSPAKFERDHDGEIWEWYDEGLSSSDLEMIKAIITSKKSTIRFAGDKYYNDRTISTAEKKALQSVLDAYSVLGGT